MFPLIIFVNPRAIATCIAAGPEIAALITEGCIIGSHEIFSEQLQEQQEHLPPLLRMASNYSHWIFGSYLITGVEEDDGLLEVNLEDNLFRAGLHRRLLEEGGVLQLRGREYVLAARLALADVAEEGLLDALASLQTPAKIALMAKNAPNCGEDSVCAVNLTRCIDHPVNPSVVTEAVEALAPTCPGARNVEITHFLGGPCDSDEVVTCIVYGGNYAGWTVVKDVREAVKLAAGRAGRRVGDVSPGQTVKLTGLKAKPELNGEVGLALYFLPDAGRW